ncbi:SAM-dependent methyltransferase [Sorangium sp. So ce128]|uniref:SAM-dependent methyltransferase n=1 Tax=Sorangium sp. So ce128 TaxID=3133281 RepID=UPI003F60B1CE
MHRCCAENDSADTGSSPLSLTEEQQVVAAFYDEKTRRILAKYGPGPRVHYHTGFSDGAVDPRWSLDELRARLIESQEALLAEVTRHIAPRSGGIELLDVGCGLGGGSLYWAESLRARVTAITLVPSHAAVVRALSKMAGVADRVRVFVRDAHALPGSDLFDAAVAIETSCYLERRTWFERLASLLKPGGSAHIADWFVGRPEAAPRVDTYYRTRMGSPDAYRSAARAAGLRTLHFETWSDRVAGFWSLSRAWSEAAMMGRPVDDPERARLERSRSEHAHLGASFANGDLLYGHMIVQRAPLGRRLGAASWSSAT